MSAVVGIDPGGKGTGIVARDGARLIYHKVVVRNSGRSMTAYICEVVDGIDLMGFDLRHGGFSVSRPLVAVEDVGAPSPHMGTISVSGLLGTAQVLGAVLHAYPDAIVVPPGGHGSAPLISYPRELVGAREKKGTGEKRHLRSAWDVAGAAVLLDRIRRTEAKR